MYALGREGEEKFLILAGLKACAGKRKGKEGFTRTSG